MILTGADTNFAVIYGSFVSNFGHKKRHMFRWTNKEGYTDLGTMSEQNAIGDRASTNGNCLVERQSMRKDGFDMSSAYLWSERVGAIDLGRFGEHNARASAISADGNVVTGSFEDKKGNIHAFIL